VVEPLNVNPRYAAAGQAGSAGRFALPGPPSPAQDPDILSLRGAWIRGEKRGLEEQSSEDDG
jgi:hypothetical protein